MRQEPVHHGILGIDLERFSRREWTDPIRSRLRGRLGRLVYQALAQAGIPRSLTVSNDTGDGLLLLVNPQVSTTRLLHPLIATLASRLADDNRQASPAERMRLRVVVHAGEVLLDEQGPGFTGASVIHAARLLDARAGRAILDTVPDSNLVLLVSEQVYRSVVRHNYPGVDPDGYQPVWVQHKETGTRAWARLPDEPTQPDLASLARVPVTNLPAPNPAFTGPPRQLPSDVYGFTGRAGELEVLDGLLATVGSGSAAVVISAVSGTAGVGKTALALHWAHRVSSQFPDGHLYVDLRGYDPDEPLAASDALGAFLRALGVDGAGIPHEQAERAARYRTLLAGRRMLVVLDNAGTVEQVRPLLPGTASCFVVVTSRDSLAGLVVREGARRINLDLLPMDEAVALLRVVVGARVDAESEAAAALAESCARLPLALRVAAELVAARPSLGLAEVVEELADESRRLDLLDVGGDERSAVRVVFSWSYRHLPLEVARTFRLLGLHPGRDLDLYAAAAATGTDLKGARRWLDALARAHLLEETTAGRFRMHDLLRAYAARLAIEQDTAVERRAALTQLLDHYLHAACLAMDLIAPHERHLRPRIPAPATPIPVLPDYDRAAAWLEAERPNLLAVGEHSAYEGRLAHTTRLSATLHRYLYIGAYYTDALTLHANALAAARSCSDQVDESHALLHLGLVCQRLGRYAEALGHYQQALAIARVVGDRTSQGRALNNLGALHRRMGRYEVAAEHLEQALVAFRQTGDRTSEGHSVANLGAVYELWGRYGEALDHYQQAAVIARVVGDRTSQGNASTNLGALYRRMGRYEVAAEHLEQALVVFRQTGDRAGQGRASASLGAVYELWGRYGEALDHYQQALAIAREVGDRRLETEALNGLGETAQSTTARTQALEYHDEALKIARLTGDRHGQARAWDGLGHSHAGLGHRSPARHAWQEALAIYADMGVPEADDVRARLAALDEEASPGAG